MSTTYKLELTHVTKQFPGVRALDRVSIRVKKGSVHAIVGENGAGKSTLMKIINGMYKPDEGIITLDGKDIVIKNPIIARMYGIAMIHQELSFYPDLSIVENFFMGDFPSAHIKSFVDWKVAKRKVKELFEKENLHYDPDMLVKHCSVSDIQMLEILKAISHNAQIIIMDEPTSAISKRETAILFHKIEELRQQGISILYISHKLEEIFQISDEITVLRDGKAIVTGLTNKFSEDSLIEAMIGRQLLEVHPKRVVSFGSVIFKVQDLCSEGIFENINLELRKGEIVGIAGLVGAGRTELARALSGADSFSSGNIYLHDKKVIIDSIPEAIHHGIVMVSEDRRMYGFVGCRSIRENISLAFLKVTKGLFIQKKRELRMVQEKFDELSIRAANLETPVESLSGGNQQKVVLAKWLLLKNEVLILDDPTRGVDVGAKYEIYKIMVDLAEKGVSIILISSELPELIGMTDRLYVMNKGRFTAELKRQEYSQEEIMKYAAGNEIQSHMLA